MDSLVVDKSTQIGDTTGGDPSSVQGSHQVAPRTPEQIQAGREAAKARYEAAHPKLPSKEDYKKQQDEKKVAKQEVKKEEPKKEEPKKEEAKKEDVKKEEVKKEEPKKEEKKEEPKKEEEKKEEVKKEDEKDPLITEKNPHGVPEKYLDKDGAPKYEEVTKALKEAQKALGKKGITAVEKHTDYVYTPSEGFTTDPKAEKGFIVDATEIEGFQKEAYEAGLTKEQFNAVLKKYESVATQAAKLRTKPDPVHTLTKNSDKDGLKKVTAKLTEHFGGQEQYVAGMTSALRARDQFAPKGFNIDDPVLNHPLVIALLANVGREIGEDRTTGKEKGGDKGRNFRTPDEIRADPEYKKNPRKFDAEKKASYAKMYNK